MMKIQTISAVFAAVAIPFAITSCGSKEKDSSADSSGGIEKEEAIEELEANAEELTYSTHGEVIKGLEGVMEEMMASMSAIKDAESAEAYAQTLESIKPKMRALHASASKLDPPTPEEIAAHDAVTEAIQKKYGPAMMAMSMSMRSNPDADKIAEIMEGTTDDDEMNKIGSELGDIYSADESGDSTEPVEVVTPDAAE